MPKLAKGETVPRPSLQAIIWCTSALGVVRLFEVGFAKEVKHLLSAGVRRQLFSITDTTYRELMMEVFASFELERGMVSFNKASTI